MREFRTYGSARGAEGNLCSYRNSIQEQLAASTLPIRAFASTTPERSTGWRASTTKPHRTKNGSAVRLTSANKRPPPPTGLNDTFDTAMVARIRPQVV